MDNVVILDHLENLDQRPSRVEQILPTLATKEDLKSFATKEDLQNAIAGLATKHELRAESERTRLYIKMLIEDHDSKLELLAEHVLALAKRFDK